MTNKKYQLSIDLNIEFSSYSEFLEVRGDVYFEEETYIGDFEILIIDSEELEFNIYNVANADSQALYDVICGVRFVELEPVFIQMMKDKDGIGGIELKEKAELIKNGLDKVQVYGNIAVLHTLKIKNEYRNQGFGRGTMQVIEDYLQKAKVDFLLLKPFPLEEEEIENNLEKNIGKIISFYEKSGLKLASLNDENRIMVKQIREN